MASCMAAEWLPLLESIWTSWRRACGGTCRTESELAIPCVASSGSDLRVNGIIVLSRHQNVGQMHVKPLKTTIDMTLGQEQANVPAMLGVRASQLCRRQTLTMLFISAANK